MSGEFCCHFAGLSLPLVLRVPHQDSRQSRNDYDRLRPHHVLRQVPGHSRQRRPLRRLGRPVLLDPRQLLLPAPPPIVVRVPLVPGTVRASMPRTPALRRATRLLPLTHPWVRHEPAATLRTRALLLHAPTIAGPSARSYLLRPERPDGSFLASRPGSILASAEGCDAARAAACSRASDGARCGAAWAPWAAASEPPSVYGPRPGFAAPRIAVGLDMGRFSAVLVPGSGNRSPLASMCAGWRRSRRFVAGSRRAGCRIRDSRGGAGPPWQAVASDSSSLRLVDVVHMFFRHVAAVDGEPGEHSVEFVQLRARPLNSERSEVLVQGIHVARTGIGTIQGFCARSQASAI